MCACPTERADHPRLQSTHAHAPSLDLQNQACAKAVLTTPSRALRHVQTARARLHCSVLLSTSMPATNMQVLHVHARHSITLAVKPSPAMRAACSKHSLSMSTGVQ